MKGTMEHAGSTCCSTEEHRWALLEVAWRRLGSTAAFCVKITPSPNKYRRRIPRVTKLQFLQER